MKNYIIIIVLITALSSCTVMEKDIAISPTPTETVAASQVEAPPNPAKTPEPYKTPRVLIPEQELVYRNEEAGYQITFPESWRGYYVVTEYSPANVVVGFYGKSKTGQSGDKLTGSQQYGVDMFRIETKGPDPDVTHYQKKIGEVNGIEYFFRYFYSHILSDILDPNGWQREYYGKHYEIDEAELALVAQDEEKMLQMRQDADNAEEVIFPTFKVIE